MNAGAARVLEALRRDQDGPCSGAQLSRDLGVSRAQIWKYVELLRERGYRIEGEPGGGYRLRGLPDRLYAQEIQAGLATRWLAREIHYFDETDSTNRVADELARSGAAHGTSVIAEAQRAGRGRRGRAFHSPGGLNLYTSVVLRPDLATSDAPLLVLSAALAVAESVAASVNDAAAVEIKWPNDVLLGGRKTCGILMELAAEASRVAFLVLGIGVNLNVRREDFPEDFRDQATSLASHLGRPVDRAAFTRRLYGILEDVLQTHIEQGFASLRPRFDRFFHMPGRRIRVADIGQAVTEGVAEDVEADGALRLRCDDGSHFRALAGDVTVLDRGSRA